MFRDSLTQEEIVTRLYAPFLPADHEQHAYFKYWYLKEEALNRRLTSVFGLKWEMYITSQELITPRDADDKPIIIATGGLRVEYGGKVYDRQAVGADVLTDLGKKYNEKLLNTYKGAATDLLKRLCRMWGIGLYLTEISNAKNNKADKDEEITMVKLGNWLKRDYGVYAKLDGTGDVASAKTAFVQAVYGNEFTDEHKAEAAEIALVLALTDEDFCINLPMCVRQAKLYRLSKV